MLEGARKKPWQSIKVDRTVVIHGPAPAAGQAAARITQL
jgi:hypothetical protein